MPAPFCSSRVQYRVRYLTSSVLRGAPLSPSGTSEPDLRRTAPQAVSRLRLHLCRAPAVVGCERGCASNSRIRDAAQVNAAIVGRHVRANVIHAFSTQCG